MNLPNEIPHGLPVSDLTQAVNQLIRYCRSITPRPSTTVSVTTLSNGTTFRVNYPPGGGGGGSVVQVQALNQFKVTCVPDGEHPAGKPPTLDWLISANGGTAQAMFGTITSVSGFEDESYGIGIGERAFVSLVYKIEQSNGDVVHHFEDVLDIRTGRNAPQNTANTFYFPVAIVEYDGTVLQGHLGAVYLARPTNVVELNPEDEEAEE